MTERSARMSKRRECAGVLKSSERSASVLKVREDGNCAKERKKVSAIRGEKRASMGRGVKRRGVLRKESKCCEEGR
jgi:hypothetical protein